MRAPARVFITAAALYLLSGAVIWSLPFEGPWKERLRTPYRAVFLPLGLWQGWDMFAPDPRSVRVYLTADLKFQDRTERIELPRMERLGFWNRYVYETYRKWGHDYFRLDDYRSLWPSGARWVLREWIVARLRSGTLEARPLEVRLNRHWSNVELSELDGTKPEWREYEFFRYPLSEFEFVQLVTQAQQSLGLNP